MMLVLQEARCLKVQRSKQSPRQSRIKISKEPSTFKEPSLLSVSILVCSVHESLGGLDSMC